MIPAEFDPIASHIWQSTLFAAAAVLLTFALRRNQARVRYAILLAASYKFLLPFSWLVSLGREFQWRTAPAALPHAVSTVTDVISAPAFFIPAADAKPVANHFALLPLVIGLVWVCGSLIVIVGWMREWLRLRAVVRTATPFPFALPIPVVSICSGLEPGVFGIFRPVLLLPEGIAEKLSPAQLRVVLAHELCHVRRRDNLAAALHMLVEAIFWFHPLVWWLDGRIVEERERACDEEVIRMGSDPAAYVETILAICKSYVECPVACVSGISASDLKRRVVNVMANRGIERLGQTRKLLLSALGMAAIVAPIVFGIVNAPLLRAQSSDTADWEKAAGGKMSFEVASIKPSAPDERAGTNVGFDSGDDYDPSGGLLRSTSFTAASYISFAYKLSQAQRMALQHEGPKWIHDDRFDLEARAPATATKDQLRLMMQSLLADRFKLAIHMERREIPMFGLVFVKEGKLGPHLRHYADDPPCSLASGLRDNQHPEDLVGGLPPVCDAWIGKLMPDGHASFGARNVTMEKIADGLPTLPHAELDRPVVDQTGLTGTFDFWLELSGNVFGPLPGRAPAAPQTNDTAPSFVEILRDQLGLKLVPTTGQVDTPVIDHIEEPTPN